MALKVSEYSGQIKTGNRGRAPSAESIALAAAMEKSVETGKPQLIDGIPQRDMEAMRKRLYVMAVGKNYSLRTGFTENGSGLIVQASPKGEGAAVEVVEEKVEEIVVVPTPRPRRTTRKATTATKK